MQEYDPETYWQSMLSQSFTLKGVGWITLSLAFNTWQYRARRAAVHSLVPDASGLRVLDVGAGTGYWIAFWHALNAAHVSGIDLTETSVEKLRERFPSDRFERADITKAIPLGGPFELISAIDVLLHIPEEEAFIQALLHLRQVSAEGGRLLLLEPITFGPPPPFTPGQHSRARGLGPVRRALAQAGWRLDYVRPALWVLTTPVEMAPGSLYRLLNLNWRVMERLARSEVGGQIAGATLYPIDRLLCKLRWGPTSKVLLATAT